MRDRLDAMRRVLAVQQQVKRLAEYRLVAVGQEAAELAEARAALDRFVEAADLPGGLAGLALRQRGRLAERQEASAREAEAQALVTREASTRERLAERLVDALDRDARAVQARRDLEATIEAFANRPPDGGASLP